MALISMFRRIIMTINIEPDFTDAMATLNFYPTLTKFLWGGTSMESGFTSWFKDQICKPTSEQAMLYHLLRKNHTRWISHLKCLESRLDAIWPVPEKKTEEWKHALESKTQEEWYYYFSEIEWIGYLLAAGVDCQMEVELPKRNPEYSEGPNLDIQATIVHRPIFFEIKSPGEKERSKGLGHFSAYERDSIDSALNKIIGKISHLSSVCKKKYQPLIAFINIIKSPAGIDEGDKLQIERFPHSPNYSDISAIILTEDYFYDKNNSVTFKRWLCNSQNPDAEHLTQDEIHKLKQLISYASPLG